MMNRLNNFFFYLGFFLFSGGLIQTGFSQNQTPSPDLNISIRTEGPVPSPLYANTPFDWGIIVRWIGEPDSLTADLSTPPAYDKLTMLSSSVSVKTGSDKGALYTEKTFYFHFLAPKEGEYAIDSAQISYKTKDGKEDRIRTSKSSFTIFPEPFSFTKTIIKSIRNPYFLVFVSLLFLVFLCVTLFRWKRTNYQPAENQEPDWKEEQENLFQKAHRQRLEGDFRSFAHTLEQTVCLALSKEFPEHNHKVLIDYKEILDTERQNRLQLFIDTQVHVKYAPGTPSPDVIDQLWFNAKSLIK